MPDVLELFETTTRDLRLEPGALERQHRRQRHHRTVQTASVITVIAVVVALAAVALTNAWRGAGPGPAQQPPAPMVPLPPQFLMIDSTTGRILGWDPLIQNVATDSRAALSSDDSRAAFVRPFEQTEQIYVTKRENVMTARRLTGPGRGGCDCGATAPSWSPDGQRIAFAGTNGSGTPGIYIVNVTTGELRRVTHSHWFEESPAWSPDGRTIAFVRARDDQHSLWTVDVATGDTSLVSRMAMNPAWSPDGTTIAFTRPGAVGLDSGIWLVRLEDAGVRQLTNVAVTSDGNLSWSPDGSEIAFAAPRTDGRPPYVDVAAVNVTTGEVRVIARGFDYPTWSADRRAILALKP